MNTPRDVTVSRRERWQVAKKGDGNTGALTVAALASAGSLIGSLEAEWLAGWRAPAAASVVAVLTYYVMRGLRVVVRYLIRSRRIILESRLIDSEAEIDRIRSMLPEVLHLEFQHAGPLKEQRVRSLHTGDENRTYWVCTLDDVRITNLSNRQRASLRFTLEATMATPDGRGYQRIMFGQDNGRSYVKAVVRRQEFSIPLDIAPESTVNGQIGFFLGKQNIQHPPDAPDELKWCVLHITDSISETTGRAVLNTEQPQRIRGAAPPDG